MDNFILIAVFTGESVMADIRLLSCYSACEIVNYIQLIGLVSGAELRILPFSRVCISLMGAVSPPACTPNS